MVEILVLNTGLLDADALAETLIIIPKGNKPDELFNLYFDERCKVFQYFVNPTTTDNKLRLHRQDISRASTDDYYLRAV